MSQIIIEDVSKVYSVNGQPMPAVKTVSLTIEKSDFVSIVGHSGSGKTTLLSMIGGITNPTSGRILFEGTDIYTLSSDQISEYRCDKIGFMFQFASLLPMLTAKENLLLPRAFSSNGQADTGKSEQKASHLLEMVGLIDKINAYPSQLSGGQQRRVAIARAFMNEPAIILADEPTGDLDEDTELDMMNFFNTMNRAEGITFIMVTHNSDLAKQTKRQIRMHLGSIQEK